jgi:hypothetical protein
MVVTRQVGGASITGPADFIDNLEQLPEAGWPELIEVYREFCHRVLPNNCRELLRLISSGEAVQWAGYGSREAYIRDGLGLEPRAAEWAVRGLRMTGSDAGQAITYQQAQAIAMAQEGGEPPLPMAMTPAEAGTLGGRGKKASNNVTSFKGNSAAYIVARLKRDHPAVAARLAAGEFQSAAAAGRAAGIVKSLPTPLERLEAAWNRCTPADQDAFMRRHIR